MRSTRAALLVGICAAIVALTQLLPTTAAARSHDRETASAAGALPDRPIDWLVPGDSYTAGFGLPGVGLTTGCTQSKYAWPRLTKPLAKQLGYDIDRYREVACTGAVLADLTGQVTGTGWDLMTFSIGGNDAGFKSALLQCIVGHALDPTPPAFKWLVDPVFGCPDKEAIDAKIDDFGSRFPAALDEMADHATAGGNIVVIGYPWVFEAYDDWTAINQAFGLCHGVDRAGVERIWGWAQRLNKTIELAVTAANQSRRNGVGFTFVEANSVFAGHNLCGSDPWMFGLGIDVGLFHPNPAGHVALAKLVGATLSRLDWSRLDVSLPTTKPPTTPPVVCVLGPGGACEGSPSTPVRETNKPQPTQPKTTEATTPGPPPPPAPGSPPPPPAGQDITFTVRSTSGWQQTPISVRPGQSFFIDAYSGSWTVDARNLPYVDADGYPFDQDDQIYKGCKHTDYEPYGRLLGRVGNGEVLVLGRSYSATDGGSGPLYLRINDLDSCLGDNAGSISVRIRTT